MRVFATPQVKVSYSEWEQQTIRLLQQYLDYLKNLKGIYAPKTEDDVAIELFVECVHAIPQVEYYLDILWYEPLEVRQIFMNEYVKQLEEIEIKLDEFKRKYRK